jgi:processive 1,2-diacylglycerol beta-glucosyltransferase
MQQQMHATILQRGHLAINTRPGSACDFHRVTQPYMLSDIAPKRPVMVFNRLPTFDPFSLPNLRKNGVAIVVDLDDHFVLGQDHPLHDLYEQDGMRGRIEFCVRYADLVTVSTAYLADQIRPYNANVEVIPNALPFDTGIWTKSTDTTSKSPFVYAGGATHRKDLALIRGAYTKGDLTIVGYEGAHPEWQAIREEHPDAVFEPLIGLQDWRNFITSGAGWTVAGRGKPRLHEILKAPKANYMSAYDGHACAIAPLVDNPFNRCKSNLKVLEAGAKGIPIICSQVPPYVNPVDARFTEYVSPSWGAEFGLFSRTWARESGAALAEHVRRHYHLKDANLTRKHLIEAL